MTERVRLLLVDDQELIRVGFRLILEAESDLEIVGEASDGSTAVASVATLQPDVVLMDIRMPGSDGISATQAIVRAHSTTRVLVLTTFDLDEYAFRAIQAGASGFLLKDARREELVTAIHTVHRGDAVLAPRITRTLLERVAPRPRQSPPAVHEGNDPMAELTEREREIFFAIAQGLNNGEIAERHFLSESTVKTHVGRLLAKLNARDRIHLVILAHQLGLG